MRRFLTASHGPLAGAILESAALVAGRDGVADVAFFGVEGDDSRETIKQKLSKLLTPWEGDEILVLTDIAGGNITNILVEYLAEYDLHIIAGMNLGMVLELMMSEESTPLDELIEVLEELGRMGVRYINREIRKAKEGEL